MADTKRASCLCGDVRWEVDGGLEWLSSCHCSRCRKHHGTGYATFAAARPEGFRLEGTEAVVRFESSPGIIRPFCRRCGSVVPGDPWQGLVLFPAGNLLDEPGVPVSSHIFVASKAPWDEILDDAARFDGYPDGVDIPEMPDPPPGEPSAHPRGSCLCGAVAFVVEGEPLWAVHCHCGRCRRGRSAAHATNLVTRAGGVRLTRGEGELASFELPDARFFMQVFCRVCGSPAPRIDHERDLAIVPMGALDDDPGIRPQQHIFVGSKADWDVIRDDLPQNEAGVSPRR